MAADPGLDKTGPDDRARAMPLSGRLHLEERQATAVEPGGLVTAISAALHLQVKLFELTSFTLPTPQVAVACSLILRTSSMRWVLASEVLGAITQPVDRTAAAPASSQAIGRAA